MSSRASHLPPDQVCKTVLVKLNRALERAGRPGCTRLPQGTPGKPEDCVIHRALRPLGATMSVLTDRIVTNRSTAVHLAKTWGCTARISQDLMYPGQWEVGLPVAMRELVAGFDSHAPGFDHLDAAFAR